MPSAQLEPACKEKDVHEAEEFAPQPHAPETWTWRGFCVAGPQGLQFYLCPKRQALAEAT